MRHTPLRRILLALFVTSVAAQTGLGVEPAAKRGLYAIWYPSSGEPYLSQPYIRGGQIVVQWADVEPAKGVHDFSAIDQRLEELRRRGLYTTIQINGNLKPDWLFDEVPYIKERLSIQVRDKRGSLMFWHPTHEKAYLDMLRALAEHLRATDAGETLLGLRMNFNAFGTEHHYVEPDDRPLDRWTVPPGATTEGMVPWSREVADEYIGHVMDTYIESISPIARVFVRNGIPEELETEYRDAFESGKLSWFHTSSEAEPRSHSTEFRYQRFVDDCVPGKTTAYAEPWASAWGDHGGQRDDRWCSPPQWNYWRLLLDLHCGVSFIALYSQDMRVAIDGEYRGGGDHFSDPGGPFQREFLAAFQFADKYVGYHASPEESPGAWIAFRENDVIRAANGKSEQSRRLTLFTEDYRFLMRRLPGDASTGLGVGNVGPDQQRYGAFARVLPQGESIRLALNETFAASVAGGQVTVRLIHFDRGNGEIRLRVGNRPLDISCQDTGRWQTASLEVPGQLLRPDDLGAHLTVTASDGDATLHMVEVARGKDSESRD